MTEPILKRILKEKIEIVKEVYVNILQDLAIFCKSPKSEDVQELVDKIRIAYQIDYFHDEELSRLRAELHSCIFDILQVLVELDDIKSIEELVILEENSCSQKRLDSCKRAEIAYRAKLKEDSGYRTQEKPIYTFGVVGSKMIELILKLDAKLDAKEMMEDCEYFMSERSRDHIIKACVGYYGPYKQYLYQDEPFVHEDDLRKDFERIYKEEFRKCIAAQEAETNIKLD